MARSEPESLPAALFRQAEERPEDPWLFVREGWDWRWSSFDEVTDRVEAWAGVLAGAFPAGARLAFPDLPLPRAVVLDLAIQAAGCAPMPIPSTASFSTSFSTSLSSPPAALADRLARSAAVAWLGEPLPADLPPGVAPFELPSATPEPGAARSPARPPRAGAVIDRRGEPVELSQADLVAAARAMQAALAGSLAGSGNREIAVLAPPLAGEPARRLLAWATLAGAALLLEPEPAALAATAAWARPTVFVGDAAALAALARAVPPAGRLRSRVDRLLGRGASLPFGRLHTLFVAGPAADPRRETAAELDTGFWTARGVRVLPLP